MQQIINTLSEMSWPLAVVFAAQIVVFAIIVVVLRRMLLGDTMNAVNRMKAAEADLAKKEESMRQRVSGQEEEFQRRKADAEEELKRQRETADQDVARLRERTKAEARIEADKIISEAQLNKEKIRESIVREMDAKTVERAGDLFKLVVSKGVTEKLNEAFVDELIGALEDVDETTISVDASEAEFKASHKLGSMQRSRLESLIKQKFGVDIRINEQVEENLLAGLVIKLGSLEIDGSLLNRYREGVEEIKRRA